MPTVQERIAQLEKGKKGADAVAPVEQAASPAEPDVVATEINEVSEENTVSTLGTELEHPLTAHVKPTPVTEQPAVQEFPAGKSTPTLSPKQEESTPQLIREVEDDKPIADAQITPVVQETEKALPEWMIKAREIRAKSQAILADEPKKPQVEESNNDTPPSVETKEVVVIPDTPVKLETEPEEMVVDQGKQEQSDAEESEAIHDDIQEETKPTKEEALPGTVSEKQPEELLESISPVKELDLTPMDVDIDEATAPPTVIPDETELARDPEIRSVDTTELARKASSVDETELARKASEESDKIIGLPSPDPVFSTVYERPVQPQSSLNTTSTVSGQDAFDMVMARSMDSRSIATSLNNSQQGGRLWKEAHQEASLVQAAEQALASEQHGGLVDVDGSIDSEEEEAFQPLKSEVSHVSDENDSEGEQALPSVATAPSDEDGFSGENSEDSFDDEHNVSLQKKQRFVAIDPVVESRSAPESINVSKDREQDYKFNNVKNGQRRRHVIQLLVVGSMASLAGILGNFFIGFTCYFASAPIEAGVYGAEFDLHYGLWVYSPPQSAMAGYPYCNQYDEDHEAPLVARGLHLAASSTGLLSVCILWFYLITGRSSVGWWKGAIWMAALATMLQLLMFLFYGTNTCSEHDCEWGVGSSLVLVSAFAWAILALEMRHQARYLGFQPVPQSDTSKNVEMTSLNGSEDYRPPVMA